MHASVLAFLRGILKEESVAGVRILEVGAFNVNGSARDVLEPLGPSRYLGVDTQAQDRYVDLVCDVSQLVEQFGAAAFDVVISTEMLEHCRDWKVAVEQMNAVLSPGGL